MKHIRGGNEEKKVLVFTDELYINQNYASKFSSLSKDDQIHGCDRKSSKGRRLIILHAITPDGPLCERDENGYPVSDFKWKKIHQIHNNNLKTYL